MKSAFVTLYTGCLILAQVANAEPVTGAMPRQESSPATTLAAGRLGIISDSLAAGTHSSKMCGNRDIIECMDNTLAKNSYEWSYAGGAKSWSIAILLGYSFDRVVNASVGGEEWKDALKQAN